MENVIVNNKFLRGSEWRKWDLHVHTKGTAKNDQFNSKNFDEFCVTLLKKALLKKISVIGITDYFSIENYKKVKFFIESIDNNNSFNDEERLEIKKIFIIPNVELRMLPSTSNERCVNIHCLFNPIFINSIENDFFNSIEFHNGSKKYKMNKTGMIELGKNMENNNIGDEKAYTIGINNFVVAHADLQKLYDESSDFLLVSSFICE